MRRPSDDLSDPDRNLAESSGDPSADISDNQDIDLLNITEENRTYTPPPRIAARFYRPTNNRRKSSAASSRRNSISSAHSHQSHASNRSYHGGPQSNHVAQHLRRASIIESRKARLADRAAHAEKVRLRAALAKAAPRSTNNSEERALAAQQAREKNLAEIVASCAEEVRRAKGIAESMKEKREAEGKKLRREMEERLAEAERRREEILSRANGKRGRSSSTARDPINRQRKSLSPMPEVSEAISETTAVTRIQQKWRVYQRWKALKEFADLGLTIEGVRDTSFEDVVSLLAQEKVLLGTAKILRLCGLKEGESGSVNEMTAVRTFLSAFLILGHPTQVLSNKSDSGGQEQVGITPGLPIRRDDLANPQLQDLVAKARDLLVSFENVLGRLTPTNNYTPPPAQHASLSESYATFFNSFIAWKARDSNTLIDMMVLQFVELDAVWQTVKDSTEEAVTASYRDGIRENQLKLMVRIKRLAGAAQGKRLIANAIREARKTRTRKPEGDSRPRAADGDSSTSPIGSLAGSEHAVRSHLQTLTPPATPRREQTYHTHAEELRTSASILPDNRSVVHELAINKEYRIAMEDCLEQRGVLNRVIFDSMRQEVQAGNSDAWVLAMAENIKGKLQKLLQPGNSLHVLIGDALDTKLISRELQNGSFSYERFFSFMSSILPKLCAPVRDAEVKDLIENGLQQGDFVGRLEALMGFIDLMQLDYANFMLQQSAPGLIKHATLYEQKRFAEDLDQGLHMLEDTERWWRAARSKVLAEVARRDPEGISLPRHRPTPEKFYHEMLVDTFTSVSSTEELPETLRLDSRRISRIRSDILHIITAGAILLQSKNLLKRDVRSQWKTEASRVLSVLERAKSMEETREGVQAALESSRSMPTATKAHIRELVRRITDNSYQAASSGQAITEPVMRLLLARLHGHILGRVSAITASEKVKATSTASESLATLGLPEFVPSVGKIVDIIGRVGMIDREAHAIWYELIAKKVEAQDMVSSGSESGSGRVSGTETGQ
jgi:T-complex protein 11